jgi:hypothetical protein
VRGLLRMAKATLPAPDSPEALLAEVRRLYRLLEQLPIDEKPKPQGSQRASARYLELETQIRALADRYRACYPETGETGG